ncbi:PepSY domain-containing protein [Algimonas porphyrae]|uniref:PepSY domain-containing protein n=1 Tax=Algimonas porphyrae TaxID=1128113 RepID=UPI00352BA962
MSRFQFLRIVRQAHYWSGWALGLLALSWFATGFFMTLKPIEEIRGNHLAGEPAFDLIAADYSLPLVNDARSVTLIDALGTPAFIINRPGGRSVIDARTGVALPAFEEAAIRNKVGDVLKVKSEIAHMRKLDRAPMDYSGPLPVWQVTLTQPANARLYIDATTGQLIRVRTSRWRWFDIAWRIHILEPSGENFNTWWICLASGLATLFALSGLILLWRPRRRSVRS